jgi:LysM repeat protein
MELKDFPRPSGDNGRGLHGCASAGWSGGNEGYDFWIGELVGMQIKWFKVLDDCGDSLPFCERLLAAGIIPIVRVLRKDPPPNDSPEPNPGHIGPSEEKTIKRLIEAGVRYLETNNEPNLSSEWKHNAMPSDRVETAKLVALNWLFDARFILEAGGLPGIPAVSVGGDLDLLGALVSLGHQDILKEGCWIALHNYGFNRPLNYPDDPVNRSGLPLTDAEYDQGPYTEWAWWNSSTGRPDRLDQINAARALDKNPTLSILQDHACFREFEYYNMLAMKYLGQSIPIISTEGGYLIGRREDTRYPRLTPESHRDMTVAMYEFMQRQAPDYYFAAMPWLLIESPGLETDAWNSSFWPRALKNGSDGRNGIPPVAVPGVRLVDQLPVINAVKVMPSLARRLPGAQPAPPVQPAVVVRRQSGPPRQVPAKHIVKPAGQVLPAAESEPVKYVVAPGDTLSGIAKRFGTTWQTLAAVNSITTPYLIRPGQTLSIPLAGPSQAQPAAEAGSIHPIDTSVRHPDWVSAPAGPSHAEPSPAAEVEPEDQFAAAETGEREAGSGESEFGLEREEATEELTQPADEVAGSDEKDTLDDETRVRTEPPPPVAFAPRLDWDPRLDALGASVEEARVQQGQIYWKLVQAEYQGPSESRGKHHIYYVVLDERGEPMSGQKVWQGWPSDKTDATTGENGEANLPLWSSYAPDRGEIGPYSAWVDGFPSDRVHGLGLPSKSSVCFLLKWQRAMG